MIIKKIPLSELCLTITDGAHSSPKSVEEDTYKIASVKDIKGTDINVHSCKNISKHDFEILKKNGCVPQADDILVGKDGANFFEDIIVFRGQKNIGLLSSIAIIRVDKEKADPKFLHYYLKQTKVKKDVRDNYGSGSAIPRIILKDFKRLPVELPELKHQKKVANILSSFDSKIEINNQIIKKLEELSKLYVHNTLFFNNSPKNPTKLSAIAEIHQETFNPKKHAGILVEHYSIPAFDSEKYPTFEPSDNIQSNKNKISDNCVLFSKLNPSTKRVWQPLCLTNYPITSTEFVALRPKEGYSRDLIFAIINSNEFNSFICTKTTGSTNSRQRIRPSDALLFELTLPCPDQLALLDKLIHPIYQLHSTLIQQNISLKNIRDSLLPKLFSGEIELKN